MKQRFNEPRVEFQKRVSRNLPQSRRENLKGLDASEWMVARYKTTHPRLTKKLDFSVGSSAIRGTGGSATLWDQVKRGESAVQWGMRKPLRQAVKITPRGSDMSTAAFIAAHELRHIADYRHKTNAQIKRSVILQKLLVPYGFRPDEWRANFAGAKAATKVLSAGRPLKEAKVIGKVFKGAMVAQNLALGTGGAAIRTAPVVAAAIMYKRHLRKKAALAAAAT